jgi:hypothetical protein
VAETEPTQENIAYIRTHVDQIERMMRFTVASAQASADFVETYLRQKKGAAELYLKLSDKPLGLDELMKLTRQSKPNVSKICSHLAIQGMIAKVPDPDRARSFKYCWTDLENILGVSRIARRIAKG